MQLKIAVPDKIISPAILQAALETSTRANHALIEESGKIPKIQAAIKRGVRWRPEPPGTGEELALAPVVVGRGWGDCDDLAPWRAAELRATGEDPGARAVAVRSGPRRWHAVVRRSTGEIEDPSRWAGMRSAQHTLSGEIGLDPLALPRQRALAVIPRPGGGWSARVDLPSRRQAPLHICACAHDDDPRAALIRAAQGAAYAAPAEAEVLDQVVGALCGSAEEDGEQMGFLGDLVKAASGIVTAIPGVGQVVRQAAGLASGIASPLLRQIAPVAQAAAPALGPAGIALQAIPALQSLLEALAAQGGQVRGPALATAPALPATPILPGQPTYSLPLPLPGASGQLSYGLSPGQPSPLVARW